MHYGFPEKNLSNQGCNFESKPVAELCKLSKTKKLQTMPYQPKCKGQCEHFNSTLISMIGILPIEGKIKWQEQLPTLVHAYNCSCSNVTGFSPFYLMYGRQPMLPIDIQFGVRTPNIVASTSPGYIQMLQKRLNWHIKLLRKLVRKNQNVQKEKTTGMLNVLSWNQEI